MKVIKIKFIQGISGFFINLFALTFSWISWGSLKGWTSAWDTIYIRKDLINDERLLGHELCHVHQMNRLGKIKFMFLYTMEQLKSGYRNNKYEVEARAAKLSDYKSIYSLKYELK